MHDDYFRWDYRIREKYYKMQFFCDDGKSGSVDMIFLFVGESTDRSLNWPIKRVVDRLIDWENT